MAASGSGRTSHVSDAAFPSRSLPPPAAARRGEGGSGAVGQAALHPQTVTAHPHPLVFFSSLDHSMGGGGGGGGAAAPSPLPLLAAWRGGQTPPLPPHQPLRARPGTPPAGVPGRGAWRRDRAAIEGEPLRRGEGRGGRCRLATPPPRGRWGERDGLSLLGGMPPTRPTVGSRPPPRAPTATTANSRRVLPRDHRRHRHREPPRLAFGGRGIFELARVFGPPRPARVRAAVLTAPPFPPASRRPAVEAATAAGQLSPPPRRLSPPATNPSARLPCRRHCLPPLHRPRARATARARFKSQTREWGRWVSLPPPPPTHRPGAGGSLPPGPPCHSWSPRPPPPFTCMPNVIALFPPPSPRRLCPRPACLGTDQARHCGSVGL